MSFSLPGQSIAVDITIPAFVVGTSRGRVTALPQQADHGRRQLQFSGESGDGSDGYAGLLGTYRDGGPVLAGAGGRTRHTVFAQHLGVAPLGLGTRPRD